MAATMKARATKKQPRSQANEGHPGTLALYTLPLYCVPVHMGSWRSKKI